MEGLIVKPEIEDSGTTNITGLTWVKHNNTITVSAYDVSVTSNVTITGLPTPSNNAYILGILVNGSDILGAVQFASAWDLLKIGSGGAHAYGSFTYTI